MHTGNGLFIPLIAATSILIFTKYNDTLDNRLSFYDDIGYTKGYYGSFSNITHLNIGINYMLRDYLSVGAELSQVYVSGSENNTYGIGIRLIFRFYPLNKENFKLYFQSGVGLQYFFENFPQQSVFFGDYLEGTKLNGSPKYGIRTEIKLNSNWNINAGLWHIHFSNRNNLSAERNPGCDAMNLVLD
ncbi:MAG: hypothetical protein WHS65_13415 [Melioribacteraceae bacterium]